MTTQSEAPAELLKPCAFCGNAARLIHDRSSDYEAHWSYLVTCTKDDCVEGSYFAKAEDAIAAWNTRASSAVSEEMVEAVLIEWCAQRNLTLEPGDPSFKEARHHMRAALTAALHLAPAVTVREFGTEPRGCPTPGACSCPAVTVPRVREPRPRPPLVWDGGDDELPSHEDVHGILGPVAAEPVAWTGSGSLASLKAGRDGYIWSTKTDAHPVPLYALPIASAEPVAVKPLEWREWDVAHDYGRGVCEANTAFSDCYSIEDCAERTAFKSGEWQRYFCRKLSASFDTLDEAKAAAQADYESRIRSALVPIASAGEAGWRTVPVEPTRDWAVRMAEIRQGQSSTPRCEPPGEADIQWCWDKIKEVLAALPVHPAGPKP